MCGLAGIHSRTGKPIPNLDGMAEALLLNIAERGRDAAGYITLANNGDARLRKHTVPAARFTAMMEKEPKRWGVRNHANIRTMFVHTRFATTGGRLDPRNAHPHVSQSVAAVHNGTIWNADELFADFNLPRRATVDSEVVPQLVEAFGWRNVKDALELLDGGAALGLVSQKHPGELVLARVHDFPMCWSANKHFVIFASTERAIRNAWAQATGEKWDAPVHQLDDGQMVHVRDGRIAEDTFATLYPTRYYTRPIPVKQPLSKKHKRQRVTTGWPGQPTRTTAPPLHLVTSTPQTTTTRFAGDDYVPSLADRIAARDAAGYDVPFAHDHERRTEYIELVEMGVPPSIARELIEEGDAHLADIIADAANDARRGR